MGWVVAVNLVLWTGLFLLVLRLDRRLAAVESEIAAADARETSS